MKKLIFIIIICFAIGTMTNAQTDLRWEMTNAQTDLRWELEENVYISDAGDTITLKLYSYLPIPDNKNVRAKFVLQQLKNGVEQYKWRLNTVKSLDSLMTVDGVGTKTQLEWLNMFLTVNVAYMKIYMRQMFYQYIDADTSYIKP